MIPAARRALPLLAIVLAGCQSATITASYRVSSAPGHRDKVAALVQQFAAAEGLPPTKQGHVRTSSHGRPFASYESIPMLGYTLECFTLPDTILTLLQEHRDTSRRPSAHFDDLDQRLQHRFRQTFGAELRHQMEYKVDTP